MKKQTLSTLLSILFFTGLAMSPVSVLAAETKNSTETNTIQRNFYPVTINYILEGVETEIKTPKLIDNANEFWADYTLKLSNKLMYSGIDIQDTIRNYYFSHYEINGKRIESIDAIITLPYENPVINVVYAEEIPKDGYLRKGFRDGIALDNNYLLESIKSDKPAFTDLYDDTWQLALSPSLIKEITEETSELVNANDKTLYLNTTTSPISDKEQNELNKRYNYIDSIKINSSLGYKDFSNEYTLKYVAPDKSKELKGKDINLYGVNLEGKVELLNTSKFNKDNVEFTINKNTNKFQFLFISTVLKDESAKSPTTDNEGKENTQNNSKPNKEEFLDKEANSESNTDLQKPSNLNEGKIILLILVGTVVGSILTLLLSLIISTRNDNIKRKKDNL